MNTKYMIGCDPYKKISWFKKLLIWLKLSKNPNQSFTIMLSKDNFNTGEVIFTGKENFYIHSKKRLSFKKKFFTPSFLKYPR